MALGGASVGWMFFADQVGDRKKLCAGLGTGMRAVLLQLVGGMALARGDLASSAESVAAAAAPDPVRIP